MARRVAAEALKFVFAEFWWLGVDVNVDICRLVRRFEDESGLGRISLGLFVPLFEVRGVHAS